MKTNSYKMIVIPFKYVPHRVVFRFKKEWWERSVGSAYQVEKYEFPETEIKTFDFLDQNDLVAMAKCQLTNLLSKAMVVEEFDLFAKNNV